MFHWQVATEMICVEKINIWAHIYQQDARLLHNQCYLQSCCDFKKFFSLLALNPQGM